MTEQLTLGTDLAAEIRALVHDRITDVIAVFDDHDPGLEYDRPAGQPTDDATPTYVCRCRFRGTETEWDRHLAHALADALTTTTVELPE